jgi:ubiquinone/menaquinone biosynthesis C-methylase UbiE
MLKDYFQWEIRSWSRAYPLWHRTLQAMPPEGRHALALGERDGGLSLMLAEHGFTTVCSDLNGPTEQARTLHRTFGWDEAITYEAIDATAIPKADASFDVVVFKSMIGALGSKEKQALAIREMHRVLKTRRRSTLCREPARHCAASLVAQAVRSLGCVLAVPRSHCRPRSLRSIRLNGVACDRPLGQPRPQ